MQAAACDTSHAPDEVGERRKCSVAFALGGNRLRDVAADASDIAETHTHCLVFDGAGGSAGVDVGRQHADAVALRIMG